MFAMEVISVSLSPLDNMAESTILEIRSQLDDIKKVNSRNGVEYWMARDLMSKLGYDTWENFHATVQRAIDSCRGSGEPVSQHFRETTKMIEIGKGGGNAVPAAGGTKNMNRLLSRREVEREITAPLLRAIADDLEHKADGETVVYPMPGAMPVEVTNAPGMINKLRAVAEEMEKP